MGPKLSHPVVTVNTKCFLCVLARVYTCCFSIICNECCAYWCQATVLNGPLLDEVLRGLNRVIVNCFSLGDPDADVPFDVGRFYYARKDYVSALRLYMLSWKTAGPHFITCHNIGLCQYGL